MILKYKFFDKYHRCNTSNKIIQSFRVVLTYLKICRERFDSNFDMKYVRKTLLLNQTLMIVQYI